MKKKVFSKLLMVALVATVGVFSSCKDYDDDISDVRNNLSQTATELRNDYNAKIETANKSIATLQTLYNGLDEAYKAADRQLSELIATKYSEAVSTAQAYSDANLLKANELINSTAANAAAATAAAEKAAKDYAEVQAAAAQKAAIEAAKQEVATAKQELTEALGKANELIATQGAQITNLIDVDAKLTAAVQAAQARADEAYALADKANTLANQNKANLEKAAGDIAALQTALANLQGTAASAADVAKLQSDLAALQKTVSENVVNLADYNTNLTQTTSDLAKLKEDLAKEVSVLGESIAAVKKTADGNVAKIETINSQLATLSEANTQAHEQIIGSINTLAETVANNKTAASEALAKAVEGLEAKLAAANKLIETNDAAIRVLIDTKASELKTLIDGNADLIKKNAEAIQKNADEQKAENVIMKNGIAKNAQDIIAQGKDIKRIDDVVAALQTALGKETAATLKAYAESVAKTAADKALLDAQGYADAQDAAQKTTILKAIEDQALADQKAWNKAIEVAIGTLIETYKLNALAEMIKNAKDEAIASSKDYTDGEKKDALDKAQKMSDKALEDAKHYTDDLKTFLTTNYTNTKDMNAAIEAAKQAAVAQAFKNVMDVLFADNTDWTEDGKTTTIAKVVKKLLTQFAEEAGYTNEEAAAKIANDAIDAALLEEIKDQPGKLDREGGVIWAAIKAAADQAAQELADVNEALDARLDIIEAFLNTTSEEKTLDATIKYWIADANLVSKDDYDKAIKAINDKLDGGESELKTQLEAKIKAAQDQADENAKALLAINTALANINAKFVNTDDAEAVQETLAKTTYDAFEAGITALIDQINEIYSVTGEFKDNVLKVVNENLNSNLQSMVTDVHLFSGIHEDVHRNDDGSGYNEIGYDHHLVFTYVIEQETTFPAAPWQEYVEGKIDFKDGYVHTYADSVLIRVSPVNAKITKDMIALLNSKAEDLVDLNILEVESVEPFNRDWYITRYYGENDDNEPWGDSRMTRAENLDNGLWVVKFKLVEKNENVWQEFKDHAYAYEHNGKPQTNPASILYAVGVKNTNFSADKAEDDGINRYVISEYDLDLSSEKAFHIWNYDVNGEPVARIHNRYIVNENKPNSTVAEPLWTADQAYPTYYEELTYSPYYPETYFTYTGAPGYEYEACWLSDWEDPGDQDYRISRTNLVRDKDGNIVYDKFGEAYIYDYPGYTYENLKKFKEGDEFGTYNVVDRYLNTQKQRRDAPGSYLFNGVDNRDEYPIKVITFDQNDEWADIEIEFPNPTCGNRKTECAGFFVLLDQNFARESNTSEVQAWTQYIYEGVGFYSVNGWDQNNGTFILDKTRKDEQAGIENGVKKATLFKGPKGTIRIKNARGAKGDVIGFRVYAVNVDGTLYDPDGRAFYVKIGDPAKERTLNFNVTTYKHRGDSALQEKDLTYGKYKDISLAQYNDSAEANKDANFFNISEVSYNIGGIYHFDWSWADNNPAVRYSCGSENYFTPIADSERGLNDLFRFTFSMEDDKTVDLSDMSQWHGFYSGSFFPHGRVSKEWFAGRFREINNVKCMIKDADRLLNDSTYHLKCVVSLEDPDGAVQVVNTVYVNVTKKMPKGLPEKFGVRLTQENNVKSVAFYLRPFDGPGEIDERTYAGTAKSNVWDIYEYWFNENHTTFPKYGESAIDDLIGNNRYYHPVRWAVDVRPYNFDEFFTGFYLDAEEKVIDPDYNFVFEGAGAHKFNPSYSATDEAKDLTADAISVYRNKMTQFSGYKPVYRGLDNGKNIVEGIEPPYYLPIVSYKMIEKYPSAEKKLAVKAGYTYHMVNFTIDEKTKEASGTDYQIEPVYFDANGNTVKNAADAAFQCYFKCAIDQTFAGSFFLKTDTTTTEMQQLKPNAYADLKGVGASKGKPIPYGTKFTVYVDSLNLKWQSTLAAFTEDKATGASYFMTYFDQFTNKYTAVDNAGKSYYVDTLAVTKDNGFGSNLYRINEGEVTDQAVKYMKLVDMADPYITKVEIYNEGNTAVEKTLTEAAGNLNRINDYFEIKGTYDLTGEYGLTFIPKTTALDPNKLGQMVIYLKNSAKGVHQWGHTVGFNSDNVVIYVGNPNSTPNVNSSRRAR
jgi:hypothetical protein